jgi:hypothetical protein
MKEAGAQVEIGGELGPSDANFTGVRNVSGLAFRAARRGSHD